MFLLQLHPTANRPTVPRPGIDICLQIAEAPEITFENAKLRAVLGEDAVWKSIIDLETGTERCAVEKRIRFATVASANPQSDPQNKGIQTSFFLSVMV